MFTLTLLPNLKRATVATVAEAEELAKLWQQEKGHAIGVLFAPQHGFSKTYLVDEQGRITQQDFNL